MDGPVSAELSGDNQNIWLQMKNIKEVGIV